MDECKCDDCAPLFIQTEAVRFVEFLASLDEPNHPARPTMSLNIIVEAAQNILKGAAWKVSVG